ncbi:MAG: hypothetical protein ACXWWU_09865, partial [Candidatus Limnocylindria bacterium]
MAVMLTAAACVAQASGGGSVSASIGAKRGAVSANLGGNKAKAGGNKAKIGLGKSVAVGPA